MKCMNGLVLGIFYSYEKLFALLRFLDKMYSMSSAEALVQFMTNPRVYLKPPNPKIPCKVCVLGPPISGKSTLAKAISSKYNAMVNQCTVDWEILAVEYFFCFAPVSASQLTLRGL